MSQITTHAPGTFSWVELGTTNADAAKKFYASLFGWEPKDTPTGDAGTYTLLMLGGREVGGLSNMQKEQLTQGVPPHWLPYIAVASADETTKKAETLGAMVLAGPFDVMEHGRMSVIQDPTGAAFAIWQAKSHPGAGVRDEPGSISWCELLTNDAAKAGKFYTGLFGWSLQEMPMPGMKYTVFTRGTSQVGGMMTIMKEWGPMPSNWLTYFAVADCNGTAEKAKKLGGTIMKAPDDIPGVGRFAILGDPQGGTFAILQSAKA